MKAEVCRALFGLAAALVLAGCGDSKTAAPKAGTVDGEILPGSTSDAMVPLDTVRSQPPLADPSPSENADGEGEKGESKPPAESSGRPASE